MYLSLSLCPFMYVLQHFAPGIQPLTVPVHTMGVFYLALEMELYSSHQQGLYTVYKGQTHVQYIILYSIHQYGLHTVYMEQKHIVYILLYISGTQIQYILDIRVVFQPLVGNTYWIYCTNTCSVHTVYTGQTQISYILYSSHQQGLYTVQPHILDIRDRHIYSI